MLRKILLALGVILFVFACQTEPIESDAALESENLELSAKGKKGKKKPKQQSNNFTECIVYDADRSPFQAQQPTSNFWWSETADASDYFNPDTYFSAVEGQNLSFRTYDDGTANITGTTVRGTCVVTLDVWLKDKKTWAEWQAIGGDHKKEGTAGDASNSEDMDFYVIDSERSVMVAQGGDCVQEGTFGLEQRPGPNNPATPNFGAHIGAGGANYDSDVNAVGFSTWGWMTDPETGERLWLMDFNFRVECEPNGGGGTGCETSFAKGNSASDHACFDEAGFSRWGWNIGPLSEGTYTYDVYAGAGQCNISNGTLVGTVTINYEDGSASAAYDLLDGFVNEETHFYAGSNPFPVKNNGSITVAPGQYYVEDNLSGDIYVIAHAVTCGGEGNGAN